MRPAGYLTGFFLPKFSISLKLNSARVSFLRTTLISFYERPKIKESHMISA
jgi:hypothetical protein